MTTRDTPFAPGTPCWVDLSSSDMDASKAFYNGLFGWSAEVGGEEFGGYVTYSLDGYTVAGQAPKAEGVPGPDFWTTYIASADTEATVQAAKAAGGDVFMPTMAVGDVGTMAILVDPAGAAFGVWQAGQHTGFGRYNEPGSVTWDEHHSKDFAASTAFYEQVFGWGMDKMSDTDEFRYYTGQVDGESVAGLSDSHSYLPPEVPSHWAVYFSVDSVDDAVAKAVELGGSVVRAAEDTPFGRMADLTDSTGAMFKLHQVLPEGDS